MVTGEVSEDSFIIRTHTKPRPMLPLHLCNKAREQRCKTILATSPNFKKTKKNTLRYLSSVAVGKTLAWQGDDSETASLSQAD